MPPHVIKTALLCLLKAHSKQYSQITGRHETDSDNTNGIGRNSQVSQGSDYILISLISDNIYFYNRYTSVTLMKTILRNPIPTQYFTKWRELLQSASMLHFHAIKNMCYSSDCFPLGDMKQCRILKAIRLPITQAMENYIGLKEIRWCSHSLLQTTEKNDDFPVLECPCKIYKDGFETN